VEANVQADQEGDVMELKNLLLALKKQQKQLQSRGRGRPKNGPSGSEEAAANGNGHCSLSKVKEARVNGDDRGSTEQIENVVATGKGPSGESAHCCAEQNGNTTRESTPASEKAKKSQKRQREDEDPKSNGRKRTRAPLVELPPRVSRTRGCKETKVNHVELSSDDDFQ